MVKIDFFRSSKVNVKPGDKIIISGLISSDTDSSFVIKLHIVGTNIKKQTMILDEKNKTVVLRKDKAQKISWAIPIPDDFKIRYNFIGYVQWVSKETKEAGILSSYLFSAGSTYNVEVLKEKLIFEENEITGLAIHAINREINPINLKIPVEIKKKDTTIYKETYEVILNYEEIIEIDFSSKIAPDKDVFLIYSLETDEIQIYKSNETELFPNYTPSFIKYIVEVEDNIPIEEDNELSLYLRNGEKIHKQKKYFDMNISLINKEKYLFSLNNIVIFGLNWNDNINENPLIYDSFKDFLFSYLFLNLFKSDFEKQIDIWEMNNALAQFLFNSIKNNSKLKNKVKKLEIYCDDIITIYKHVKKRNYISNMQFKNLIALKKRFYKYYMIYKEKGLDITKKERKNIQSAVENINKEKNFFKKTFTKIFDSLEEEMKTRNIIAALRRFFSFSIKRSTNKAFIDKENNFKITMRNESDYYSLPVKLSIKSNHKGIRFLNRSSKEKEILVLPNKYSGDTEENISFQLKNKNIKDLIIKIKLDIGV